MQIELNKRNEIRKECLLLVEVVVRTEILVGDLEAFHFEDFGTADLVGVFDG